MHIELPANLQLCKLSPKSELMLFLLSEEMKNRHHIKRLEHAGFDTSYTCDLSTLILTLAGFDPRPDSLYEWYTDLLDGHCAKVSPADVEEWKEAVFDMCIEIKIKAAK